MMKMKLDRPETIKEQLCREREYLKALRLSAFSDIGPSPFNPRFQALPPGHPEKICQDAEANRIIRSRGKRKKEQP